MQLPTPLLHRNKDSYKNQFGHALILSGSPRMLGAAALTSLSCLRAGAGLVTLGIPRSLNLTAQKKINHGIMSWPLPETKEQTFSSRGTKEILNREDTYNSICLGPGLSLKPSTQKFALRIIEKSSTPLVIDADGLNALKNNMASLTQNNAPKILTPHLGEFSRITGLSKNSILKDPKNISLKFAKSYCCTLVLKGHHTIITNDKGKTYTNKTGNSGMATAGSGDVLTGIITAFLAQGLSCFEAAKFGVYIHGLAGDLALKSKGATSLIATDLLNTLSKAIQESS